MTQLKARPYYPHALLLAGASVCIALVLYSPSQTPAYQPLSSPQASAPANPQQPLADSDYSRTYTRSIADLLREARRKVVRMRMMDKSDQAEETVEQQRVSLDQAQPKHHEAKRSDQQNMLDANLFTAVAHEEYAFVSDPLAWTRPDALPAREYTVLGYGEIDNEQLTETQFLDEQSQQVSTTLSAVITEANSQAFVVPQTVAPTASVTTPATLAESAAVVPVQASQASRSIPARSAVAQPVTTKPASEKPVVLTRPATAQPVTQRVDALPVKTAQTIPTRLPARTAPQATVSLDRDSIPTAKPRGHDGQTTAPTPSISLASKTPARSDADTPLVSLPNSPVISKMRDKHNPEHATTINNRPTPITPARANKTVAPATETKPATPQFNQPDPLVVYVEDYEKIGGNKLNAIRNAISRINKDTNLPVQLELTTDSSRAYDIRFREDDSGDLGNKLGTTTTAYTEDAFGNQTFLRPGSSPGINVPEITLNSAFNWFAGEDANDIGDNEYDYETAVTHEYLHVLGLDDDFENNNAVSYSLLSPGETRRQFNDNDRDELADLYKNFNPWDNRQAISVPGRDKDHDKELKIRYKTQALTAAVPEPVSALVVGIGALVGMLNRRRQ